MEYLTDFEVILFQIDNVKILQFRLLRVLVETKSHNLLVLSFKCCRVCSKYDIIILFTSIDNSDSEETWEDVTYVIGFS